MGNVLQAGVIKTFQQALPTIFIKGADPTVEIREKFRITGIIVARDCRDDKNDQSVPGLPLL